MKLLIAAVSLFSSTAYAQVDVQSPPVEFHLSVTPAETDIISDGLQTQPFGKVVPLINKLRQQIIEQTPKPDAQMPSATPGQPANRPKLVPQVSDPAKSVDNPQVEPKKD